MEDIVSAGVTVFVSLLSPKEMKEYPAYNKMAQDALHTHIKKLKTMSGRNMTLHPIRFLNKPLPAILPPEKDSRGVAVNKAPGSEGAEQDLVDLLGQVIPYV